MEPVKASDLFADADSAKTAARRHEEYLETLNKSLSNPSTVPGQAPVADPCLLYTSPSPRDYAASRMPSSA